MEPREGNDSPFVGQRKRRKPGLLPLKDERCNVTVVTSRAIYLKYRIHALLNRKLENSIVAEAIENLLVTDPKLDCVRSRPMQEFRLTFVLSEDLKSRTDHYASGRGWSLADTINFALILFLEQNGMNAYTDPTEAIEQALKA